MLIELMGCASSRVIKVIWMVLFPLPKGGEDGVRCDDVGRVDRMARAQRLMDRIPRPLTQHALASEVVGFEGSLDDGRIVTLSIGVRTTRLSVLFCHPPRRQQRLGWRAIKSPWSTGSEWPWGRAIQAAVRRRASAIRASRCSGVRVMGFQSFLRATRGAASS